MLQPARRLGEIPRRNVATDVLACPDRRGRLRLVATIADRRAIEKILVYLGLSTPGATKTPISWARRGCAATS